MTVDGNGLEDVLTLTMLRGMAGNRAFVRGEGYYADGVVRAFKVSDGTVTARVRGTRVYQVRLWEERGALYFSCTCPVGDDGDFCKHCVAVGLTWLGRDQSGAAYSDKGKGDSFGVKDVRKFLLGLQKEELVSMLLEQAKEDDRLYRKLITRETRSGRKKLDLSVWKEAIDEAVWRDDFVYYRQAYDYVSEIKEVIDSIEELLKEGHAEAVIELAEHGLHAVERGMENIDDSAGGMGDLLEHLQSLHLSACRKAKPAARALAKRLFAWELRTEYDTFVRAAGTYADILGDAGLKVYRELAEAEWSKVPELAPGQNDPTKWGKRYRITSIMESLAQASGDVEQLVAVKSRDLSHSYDFFNIATIYQKVGKSEQALEWAERGWTAFSEQGGDARLREFIADAYHNQGRHDEAMTLTWDAFANRVSFDMYEVLKQHARKARQWPSWHDKALAHTREQIAAGKKRKGRQTWMVDPLQDHSVLVEVFLSEKDVEGAWREAQEGGCSESLWLRLAKQLQSKHPEDAIGIYKSYLARVLQHADQRYYQEAVEILEKIRNLLLGSGKKTEFLTYMAEVRKAHKRKRNLMKLLDRKEW